MARFNDILNQFGDAELPENFLPALITAYDEDMSIPNAKIEQIEAEREKLAATVADLKVQNFDLIRASSGNDNKESESDNTGDDNRVVTINDLFDYEQR